MIVTKVDCPKWDLYKSFNTLGHAWGNSRPAIELADNYGYYEIWEDKDLKGYFIINSETGTIAQLEVKNNDWNALGDILFKKIGSIRPKIKINNQDDRNQEKIAYLQKINLPNVIDQYEMEMDLK